MRLPVGIRGAAATAALLLAATTLYVYDPSRYTLTPPCLFRTATGWACPGCGLTRATHALLHGDVARAFAFNPWSFGTVPLALAYVALPRLVTRHRAWRCQTVLLWVGVALTMAFTVWRNTPVYPFIRV